MRNTILIICFFLALKSFSNYKANTPPYLSKTTLNLDNQNKPIVLYKNGFLYIKDINGSGKIEVYTIIGNKILTTNIQNFQDSKIPVLLKNQNMYIIRIETQNQVYTIKIVA